MPESQKLYRCPLMDDTEAIYAKFWPRMNGMNAR